MKRILKPYISSMKFSQNLIMKFSKNSRKLSVWIATAANRRKCRQFRARQKTTYSIWIVRDRKPSLLSNEEQVIFYKMSVLFLHSNQILSFTFWNNFVYKILIVSVTLWGTNRENYMTISCQTLVGMEK